MPSLLFWRRVLDQKRDETWWERIRRAVSLAATVLIAVALAMAVARPGPRAASTSRGKMLIVLDSSWSMLASTGSGTRWDRAVREARALAASAIGDDVALATTADGLVEGPTSDLALIETALERLAPTGGASAPWPRVGGADTVHLRRTARVSAASIVPSSCIGMRGGDERRHHRVRRATRALRGLQPPRAYLEIANYSPREQQVRVSITRGTAVVFDQPVTQRTGRSGSTGRAAHRGRRSAAACQISAPSDALSIDDEAVAWIQGAEPLTVVVVSEELVR